MNARLAQNIELNIDRAASAILTAAVAFAAFAFVGGEQLQFGIVAGALAGSAAFLLSRQVLARLAKRQRDFSLAAFEVADADSADELLLTDADRLYDELLLTEGDRLGDELVLTDADRLNRPEQEPLVLDDIVEAIGPDSRVVRLFDRRSMPTPGDLVSRIGSHIERPSSAGAAHDASQELADALAELRKALR